MKKIILIQTVLIVSLMAEQGVAHATGLDEAETCDTAIKSVYENYNIFQINPSCTCKIIDSKAWLCELYFHYSSKKKKIKE